MKIAYDKILPLQLFSNIEGQEMGVKDEEAEVLIATFYGRVTREKLSTMPKLKLVSQFGVGYETIDVQACKERGILVTNTPEPVVEPTAELCMGLILALSRRISEVDRGMRDGSADPFGLMYNMGHSLYGKTLGIIGMGNIGRSVARRAVANGMKILYHNRHRLSAEVEAEYGACYVETDELLRRSDVVSLNLPMAPEVKHLIGERELKLMKPEAYLVNTARGGHIDEQMLVRALKEGWIAGAALDVYEHEPEVTPELKTLRNCIIVPHIGTATWECRRAMADAVMDNIRAYEQGRIEDMTIVKELKD